MKRWIATLSLLTVLLLGLGALLSSVAAHASEEEMQADLKVLGEAIGETKVEIVQKSKTYHRLEERAAGPQYLWEDDNGGARGRKVLKIYAGLEIRSLLKQLDAMEDKQREIQGDLQLLRLQKEELQAAAAKVKTLSGAFFRPFSCSTLMMGSDPEGTTPTKIQVQQPFGAHKDAETGLEWKSSGWWLGGGKRDIKACNSGTVVFSGTIEGRGRVVLLDHGAGLMTLYANLSAEGAASLSKGVRVPAGFKLGLAQERMYFEVRKNGEALDPKNVVGSKLITNFTF